MHIQRGKGGASLRLQGYYWRQFVRPGFGSCILRGKAHLVLFFLRFRPDFQNASCPLYDQRDIIGFLETFGHSFLEGFSDDARTEFLEEVRTALEPQLRDSRGTWIADYVRLRFAATKVPPLN